MENTNDTERCATEKQNEYATVAAVDIQADGMEVAIVDCDAACETVAGLMHMVQRAANKQNARLTVRTVDSVCPLAVREYYQPVTKFIAWETISTRIAGVFLDNQGCVIAVPLAEIIGVAADCDANK